MPFKDTKDGQTHYENDGCGESAHNSMKPTQATCEICSKETYPFIFCICPERQKDVSWKQERKGCKCGCEGDNKFCDMNHCSDECKNYNIEKAEYLASWKQGKRVRQDTIKEILDMVGKIDGGLYNE